jgi:hypothetical protein
MRAFDPFSHTDMNSFHNINEALLVLLAKTEEASTVRSYRPISPIHSVGKLFAKVLACKLPVILRHWCTKAKSAFVKGRNIHDNFKLVHSVSSWTLTLIEREDGIRSWSNFLIYFSHNVMPI